MVKLSSLALALAFATCASANEEKIDAGEQRALPLFKKFDFSGLKAKLQKPGLFDQRKKEVHKKSKSASSILLKKKDSKLKSDAPAEREKATRVQDVKLTNSSAGEFCFLRYIIENTPLTHFILFFSSHPFSPALN